MIRKTICLIVCIAFLFTNFQNVHAQEFNVNQLPVPGKMVGPSESFSPLSLKGLVINPNKPLEFQFIVDTGSLSSPNASVGDPGTNGLDSRLKRSGMTNDQIKEEANHLVKYFLAGLTIPEGDLWVNLSPYEKDRITTPVLGQTELGRDLLAQDYILKQLTASLIYPEKDLGKEFWSRVYSQAQAKFGTANVPVNTFNKVWIVPDQAQVYENGPAAYVTKSTLKVMLDQDYVAMQKHSVILSAAKDLKRDSSSLKNVPQNDTSVIESQMVRDIVIPEITKEVNTGKNFAPLRQIFDALILAKWYKETIQNGLLDSVYTNKQKVAGVNLNDPAVKQQIYDRYLQAYKKGVFNYIKEEPIMSSPNASAGDLGQRTPRKYFSGGFTAMGMRLGHDGVMSAIKSDGAMLSLDVRLQLQRDVAMVVNSLLKQLQSNDDISQLNSIDDIVILGNDEFETFRHALRIYMNHPKARIVIAGGKGRLTDSLKEKAKKDFELDITGDLSEAVIIKQIIEKMIKSDPEFVDSKLEPAFLLEGESTNTPENIKKYYKKIERNLQGREKNNPYQMVYIQTPHQQLRAKATVEKYLDQPLHSGKLKAFSSTSTYQRVGENKLFDVLSEAVRLIVNSSVGNSSITDLQLPEYFWSNVNVLYDGVQKSDRAKIKTDLLKLASNVRADDNKLIPVADMLQRIPVEQVQKRAFLEKIIKDSAMIGSISSFLYNKILDLIIKQEVSALYMLVSLKEITTLSRSQEGAYSYLTRRLRERETRVIKPILKLLNDLDFSNDGFNPFFSILLSNFNSSDGDIAELIRLARSPRKRERLNAIRLLGIFSNLKALDVLIESISSSDQDTRKEAISAFFYFNRVEAIPRLKAVLTQDEIGEYQYIFKKLAFYEGIENDNFLERDYLYFSSANKNLDTAMVTKKRIPIWTVKGDVDNIVTMLGDGNEKMIGNTSEAFNIKRGEKLDSAMLGQSLTSFLVLPTSQINIVKWHESLSLGQQIALWVTVAGLAGYVVYNRKQIIRSIFENKNEEFKSPPSYFPIFREGLYDGEVVEGYRWVGERLIPGPMSESTRFAELEKGHWEKIEEHDLAMSVNLKSKIESQDFGGIDLNQINVNRTGNAIKVNFDPAQLNELMQGGFEGFAPVIINIKPIDSPLPLLGLAPRKEEERLAKV